MSTWRDITFSFEEVLTSGTMNNLDENFDALAEQASGAPGLQVRDGSASSPGLPFRDDGDTGIFRPGADLFAVSLGGSEAIRFDANGIATTDSVDQNAIASSAVGQGELNTTNGTVSLSSNNGQQTSRKTLPGGHYGFYTRTSYSSTDSNGTADADIVHFSGNSDVSEETYIFLTADTPNNNSVSITARQTYVQASPPYDMGDGECGLFVEVEILADGSIAGCYVAPDPVWANNGPTNIRPDWIDRKTGKGYKQISRPNLTLADLRAGICDLDEYIAAQAEAPTEVLEIDAAFKRSDMEIIPHAWASPPQGVICLLDPVNTHDLLMLHEAGEDIDDLIHRGYIRIGDECKRCAPPGVTPVSWKWKRT